MSNVRTSAQHSDPRPPRLRNVKDRSGTARPLANSTPHALFVELGLVCEHAEHARQILLENDLLQ